MEGLLGELNILCKRLWEAHAQQSEELALLRSQQLAEKEPCSDNTTLSSARRTDERSESEVKVLRFGDTLPPGTVDSPEDAQFDLLRSQKLVEKERLIENMPLRNASRADEQMDIVGKPPGFGEMLPVGRARVGEQENESSAIQSPALLEGFGDGCAFALRRFYIKSEAELTRLNMVEKAEVSRACMPQHNSSKMRRSLARQLSFQQVAYNKINSIVRNPISSPTKRIWDVLGCCLLAYDVFFIPLGVFDLPAHPLLVILEICGVLYWTSDIGMTMTTGYYANFDDEDPVIELSAIIRHYVFSLNFAFDCVLVVLDWVITIITLQAIDTDANNLSAVGVARIVRVGRVLRILKLMRASKASGWKENMRGWFTLNVNREVLGLMFELLKILSIGCLVFHYMVCICYGVGKSKGAWISRDPTLTDKSFAGKYVITGELMSRRANTVTRHLEKDIVTDTEKTFDALAWIVSTGFVTWLTSTVTSSMVEIAQRQRQRNEKIHYIHNHYLVKHQIDPRIRRQLLKFMDKGYDDYRDALQRHDIEAELLASLPVQLAKDFRREAWNPVLNHHLFFKTFDGHHMEDMCFNAVCESFCRKHEIVFKQSGMCSRMLFVFEGQHEYIMNGTFGKQAAFDSPHIRLSKGAWLSEPVLWTTSWQHRGTLVSIDSGLFCAVFPDALEILLKNHEGALHDVVRYAAAFVDELNREATVSPQSLSDLSNTVMENAFSSVAQYLKD